MRIYNSLAREVEEVVPIKKGEVGMYTCGPTVYSFAHIGHGRKYVMDDLLKRVLMFNGYKVRHVMNITDVGHLVSDADEGEDKFIDTVPFEQVSVKIIPGEKEDIIISTNKLLYVMITHTLELNSFQVKEVLPSTLLIKDIPILSQGFNASVAKSIVSVHDKYKTYDLQEHTGIESAQNANTQSKSRFKTIHILIVVFVLLICLLAYLILRPQDSVLTPNTTVPVVSPQVIPTVLVSPTEAVKVSTESATVNIATLKVQLNGASTTGGQIEDIKKNLTAIGISNIETKSDAQVTSSKTLVIFKQGMSQDFKDKIIGELRKTNQDISTQETQESSYDVIVNLATL
jgi:hypothetical protein